MRASRMPLTSDTGGGVDDAAAAVVGVIGDVFGAGTKALVPLRGHAEARASRPEIAVNVSRTRRVTRGLASAAARALGWRS